MQINAGNGWHELRVYRRPLELVGQMRLDVIWDEDDPGFQMAMRASNDRGQAWFRTGTVGRGQSFWVLLSRVPDVRSGRPDTTSMLLTPMGWRMSSLHPS